ncbi:MAG TPA: ABC transporter [Oceanospirillaceae bacterium]|nr:ABC transporter [Oceanospirillaceae bacterium]
MDYQRVELLACLTKLAQLQREKVAKVALQEAIDGLPDGADAVAQVTHIAAHLQAPKPRFLNRPDATKMPALLYSDNGHWHLVRGQNNQGMWVVEVFDAQTSNWLEQTQEQLVGACLVQVSTASPFVATKSPVYKLVRNEILSQKRLLGEAILGSLTINIVALASAFYTMQVYDRVVPTAATQTLMVLTIGVAVAILYEWLVKHFRARLFDRLIDAVDQRLARSVYTRFLAVRLDQLPPSVGSLAAQMKGYETVRSFLTSVTSHVLVDAPFALIYVALMYVIAGYLAFIPLTFFVIAVILGSYFRKRIDDLSANVNHAVNFKTGLLVESVEGAETIKSGQGGWRMLSRWMNTTDAARGYELEMKHISERAQHMIAAFQQTSYVALVASGATLVSAGELTMGSLIACSILSGRILAPVASIPNTLQQWSHTKSAIKSLDAVWNLEDDHASNDHPLVPDNIKGAYRFDGVVSQYGEKLALSVAEFKIAAGEKVGILGPVGSGKTTILRLLSGMYKPQQGRVLLDDMDLSHVSKPVLADHMGYLQQEGRLFAGTLRDNLTLGLLDPGDEKILQAARLTGLFDSVISNHPEGLQQTIHEGGQGLSGGQRQLVNLTRVFLRTPKIWLLDEPTASMDSGTELKVKQAFQKTLRADDTFVLVTHKPDMLQLVDRIVVIAGQQLVMDGPKAEVLDRLRAPVQTQVEANTHG